MLKTYRIGLVVLLAASLFAGCAPSNTKALLTMMARTGWQPQWTFLADTQMMVSSYDRHSISPDQPGWFANADASQYIRAETVNGRQEKVMMDVDGPGVIVRFWLTTFKRNGKIRIYFDNQTEPEITIPAYDLMQIGLPLGKALLQAHSSYEAKEKGGSTLYLPMPYAKHCKITFEDEDNDNQPRYYQINYRMFNRHIKLETFSLKDFKKLTKVAAEVNEKLLHPTNATTGPKTGLDDRIKPGGQTSTDLPEGKSAINYMSIKIKTDEPGDYQQALRSTVLKIEFDGEQTVWCPVGDFSGSGVGGKPLQSFYRTVTNDGEIISRWVMPYKKTAKITLLNLGDKNVYISLNVVNAKPWYGGDTNEMYFHADWKNEVNVPIKQTEKDKPTDWVLNSIEGQGIFMGETLSVYNHMHKWYGEGDQKLWVDDNKFPVEFGTGTEDYYNTSWAPVVLYQTPFANAPRADNADSFGYNTFTRTRNLDYVPFKKSFKFTLETLGWQNGTADIAATTYWYGFKGAKSSAATNQSLPTKLP
jgi:hypothetical protein